MKVQYALFVGCVSGAFLISGLEAPDEEMFFPIGAQERPLSPDGEYVVPDFATLLLNPGYPHQVTLAQSPAEGSILSGVQSLIVSVSGLDSQGVEDTTTFELSLQDVTPPSVMLGLTPTEDQLVTPDGVPYFVAPAEVLPTISASDACDSSPQLELWIDGEAWSNRFPVTDESIHTLYARATDDAGNVGVTSLVFEIRDRPYHAATAVIEQYDCQIGPEGISSVSATVYVASGAFSAQDISLSTVQMWLVGDENQWINSTGIPVKGAYPQGTGQYDHTTCEAQYEDGYWILQFEMFFATPLPGNAPVAIELTGQGLHDTPDAFDWKARTPALVHPTPPVVLNNQGLLTGDPPSTPEIEPTPTCRWKHEYVPALDDAFQSFNWSPMRYWDIFLFASGEFKRCNGTGRAYHETTSDPSGNAGSAQSSAVLRVFLEPANCCTDCQLNVLAQVSFKARANVNPPAEAATGAKISITCPCGTAEAVGGVAVGDFEQEFFQFGGYSVPTYPAESPQDLPFSDHLTCQINGCFAQLSLLLDVWMHLWAESTDFNLVAEANAAVYDERIIMNVSGSSVSGCVDPIEVDIAFPDIQQ